MQRNYRHTKDVLRHSAVYKKRKKAKVFKMTIFGILFLCVLVGLVFIARLSAFTISEIQVKGLQSANTQDVINAVELEASGSYALVLPKKNILFYPKDKIKNGLLNKFSTFADVEIKRVDTNKLEIAIVEKNANAVVCKTEEAITSGSFADCFFVDFNAKSFQAVVGEPDKSLNRFIDVNVNTASSTLSSEAMKQIKQVKDDLFNRNLVTQYVKVIDAKNLEFKIQDNGKIMISLPVGEDFLSVLGTALTTKMLSSGVKFEYVDARFGNKVFFKLENGENRTKTANIASTTASTSTASSTLSSIKTQNSTSSRKTTLVSTSTKANVSTSSKTKSLLIKPVTKKVVQ